MANIFRMIRNLFGRSPKKPVIPPTIGGHRGIAAGDLKRPDLESYAERVGKRGGDVAIGEEEAQDFLAGGNPIFVHSTNVVMIQWFPEIGKCMVEYKGGGAYLYSNVTESEMRSFLQAQSKGGFIWDHFRVRGSRTAHRKPYVRISSSWKPGTVRRETPEEKFKREVEKQRQAMKQDIESIFNE